MGMRRCVGNLAIYPAEDDPRLLSSTATSTATPAPPAGAAAPSPPAPLGSWPLGGIVHGVAWGAGSGHSSYGVLVAGAGPTLRGSLAELDGCWTDAPVSAAVGARCLSLISPFSIPTLKPSHEGSSTTRTIAAREH